MTRHRVWTHFNALQSNNINACVILSFAKNLINSYIIVLVFRILRLRLRMTTAICIFALDWYIRVVLALLTLDCQFNIFNTNIQISCESTNHKFKNEFHSGISSICYLLHSNIICRLALYL